MSLPSSEILQHVMRPKKHPNSLSVTCHHTYPHAHETQVRSEYTTFSFLHIESVTAPKWAQWAKFAKWADGTVAGGQRAGGTVDGSTVASRNTVQPVV
jgi:hypothetical protein